MSQISFVAGSSVGISVQRSFPSTTSRGVCLRNEFISAQSAQNLGFLSSLFESRAEVANEEEQSSNYIMMAVPKKKTSKMKTRSRKATWKRKALVQGERALNLAKAVLSGRTSFVDTRRIQKDKEEDSKEESA
mmetsp:Transcript_23338/g.40166  ORF Transcript_23338/g.40166 Transcript_23338/m.40166 type:complete len:133 (-) Transcript_23338:397-795(-)|eukprot:CAMPEP_0196655810 /NCGR_PEP_ID=MMETSP1086-20130531/8508_1 /TAXON_ID=77921 /ORGANISM="Cyanoptyche  gloeocystis , Strain SAG4.97" /LENGTH=132 /DNA_ID=CAMNT_0041988311 /DNA_START=75 /DNA_END=473 /DNA_ORIENTATION=+